MQEPGATLTFTGVDRPRTSFVVVLGPPRAPSCLRSPLAPALPPSWGVKEARALSFLKADRRTPSSRLAPSPRSRPRGFEPWSPGAWGTWDSGPAADASSRTGSRSDWGGRRVLASLTLPPTHSPPFQSSVSRSIRSPETQTLCPLCLCPCPLHVHLPGTRGSPLCVLCTVRTKGVSLHMSLRPSLFLPCHVMIFLP